MGTHYILSRGVLALSFISLSACDSVAVEDLPHTQLAATIMLASDDAAHEISYEGNGFFSTEAPRRPYAPGGFQLRSSGQGESRNQGFEFMWDDRSVPEVGTYQLGPDGPFLAAYLRRSGSGDERVAPITGSLEITHSTSDRLEGTFSFEGVSALTCIDGGSFKNCRLIPPDARVGTRVEITGTFEAARR